MKRYFYLCFCLILICSAQSGAALPPVPIISATPAAVNLGVVELGASSAPTVITVKNAGKGDLVINSVTITGTDGDEFSHSNSCGTVQPGGSCLVNVVFTPNLPYAKKSAILSIGSNDPKKPLRNLKLSGQVPPPAIFATPASLNFGSLASGASSAPTVITVKNNGKSDLVINAITITGTDNIEFSQTNSCGIVQPGGSCLVTVVFIPGIPYVKKSAILSIGSNDPSRPLRSVKLSGQVPPPVITATPAALNFGKLSAGTSNSLKTITLKNTGLSDLVIASMNIAGTNPGDFTISSDCGTVQRGGSCTINVLFAPLVFNVTRSASLDIASNDPRKSTVSLKLTGNSSDGPAALWDSSPWDSAVWGP